MYHSSSSVFMINNTPSGMKKYCESTEPESCQMAKMFLSFFFFFRWDSSKLRDSFPMVSHKQQHFTLSSAPALCFFTISRGASKRSLKTMASF